MDKIRLAVIGHPVSKSLSPRIHSAFAEKLGVGCEYTSIDVTKEALPAFTERARRELTGFNVTMPLKESILPLLDEADAPFGAVNTVVNRDGRLLGSNTDGSGFVMSLTMAGFDPRGKKALILGSGGAAKAVAHALITAGSDAVMATILDESSDFFKYCKWDDITQEAKSAALVVNATPLGMDGWDGDFDNFDFLGSLAAGSVVYDCVYYPRETNLLRSAKERGLAALSGISMLICQAAIAFERFTGLMPDGALIAGVEKMV